MPEPIKTDLEQGKPEMTVIHTRPTNLLTDLQSSSGVYVQCRLSNGEDAHVPLRAIFALFEKEA